MSKMTVHTNCRASPVFTMLLMMLFFLSKQDIFVEGAATEESNAEEIHVEETSHPAHSVLYFGLTLTIGVLVYYILSRYLRWFPYTAFMFILGAITGLLSSSGVFMIQDKHEYYLNDTLTMWQDIDGEVLLLVFLPGLIFKDALGQNPYLFGMGFVQLFIFAFPNVLIGTFLTAVVGFYIFPYEWPFFLCLTFGAIMSATDPVAVSALLEEVGAPPRLTTHIAGESLLNDGAAIVFFFIFKDLYLYGIGIDGLGEDINFGQGVVMFIQKAIGGCAIGLVAGGLIISVLSFLNHRFSREENVVQVMAVLGMVYLNYFVADVVCHTSGVIATLAAGLCVKFLGRGAINNIHLMDDFFAITEHVLNTLLFGLGGLVWGSTVYDNHLKGFHDGSDWGFLILLYLLLHVIRAILFVVAYPLTSRIGLGTNWKETTFQIYGGLRGAVGIALAIYLDNEIITFTQQSGINMAIEEEHVAQVYFMVGGIAFFTLILNGATAGPFLKWLGLAESTETRKRIIEAEECGLRAKCIETCVKLLTHQRFQHVDFSFVRSHVPYLSDMTVKQLVEAVKKVKETTEIDAYKPPYLKNLLAELGDGDDLTMEEKELLDESPRKYDRLQRKERRKMHKRSSIRNMMKDPLSTKEMRLLFISILRSQYEHLIDEGIIGSQEGELVALVQSLELARNEVDNGGNLNDLDFIEGLYKYAVKFTNVGEKITQWLCCSGFMSSQSTETHQFELKIRLKFAFINAHERAQKAFQQQLGDVDSDLSEGGKVVLNESIMQVERCRKHLSDKQISKIVTEVSTHRFCNIIFTQSIMSVEKLVVFGLLKESEAEVIIDDLAHHQKKVLHTKLDPSSVPDISTLPEEGKESIAEDREQAVAPKSFASIRTIDEV